MTSLRQRAIDALPVGWVSLSPEAVVDALIAAGLIADSPVHQLAAWADANDRRVSLLRCSDDRPWVSEEYADRDAAWHSSIDAAAQYALDRIAEAGNE